MVITTVVTGVASPYYLLTPMEMRKENTKSRAQSVVLCRNEEVEEKWTVTKAATFLVVHLSA